METSILAQGIHITFRTTPPNRRELVLSLEAMREDLLTSDPHFECHLREDLTEPNVFAWSEWWPASADTHSIVGSERFQMLLGAIRLLGRMDRLQHVQRRN